MILDEKYRITGMSCAACSTRVYNAVCSLNGVKELNVNLLTNSMVISYDESVLSSEQIIKAVSKAGYGAELIKETNIKEKAKELEDFETPKLLKRFIFSLILLIPLFYLSMGYMLGWPIGILNNYLYALCIIEFTLALLIILLNMRFFISGTKAVIHKSPNMDTLVMLGSGTAFIYSTVMMIILFVETAQGSNQASINMIMMNVSFETAGMVPTLITIGKTLESYSKGKTTNSIKALMNLSPKTATKIVDEKEVNVLVEEIQVNDTIIIKQGESIPVDCEVVSGYSSVDESMLTGEPIPLEKTIGDVLKSGTINLNGVLVANAIRVGNDTTLSKIIESVEKAANSKAKISKIADKVSAVFVPIVIALAIITFACWMIFGADFIKTHTDIKTSLLSFSINKGISILVISCPCALGLATPVAIMVASGKGARNGILYKNAEVIEEAGKVDFIVLDKTGTITKGQPSISFINALDNESKLMQIACSLESNSSHPLAAPFSAYAKENNIKLLPVKDFLAIPGKGIEGNIDKHHYLVGNTRFLTEKSVIFNEFSRQIDEIAFSGKTPLLFAEDGKFIGFVAVSDEIKEDSKEAISKIKNLGITPVMLTGDNYNAANYIASEVGITYIISDVLPNDKLDIVELAKKEGKVMMVGDGINDAIALTSANIGIAIGQGSDVAIDSANIVLMKSTLMDAYKAIKLSKYAYRNILENLFWAFFYNLIMIPLAAGVLAPIGFYKLLPWMGSAAMALSSVFVVLNALRINLINLDKSHKTTKTNKSLGFIDEYNQCKVKGNSMEKVIKVEGMMCQHCVRHVKEALEALNGITSVEVSLENNSAIIRSNIEIKEKDIEEAISNAGYKYIK